MRKCFEPQLILGCTPIEEVKVPVKTKNHLAALIAALQYIYVNPEWNAKIFQLLSGKLVKGSNKMGRSGMSLWEVFVLAQVRLCMNISYDELHHISNYDTLVRGVMGVLPTDYSLGMQYQYQNIYDNVTLLDDELLTQINEVIVEVGHEVFKKKGKTNVGAVASACKTLRCKTDSFVVESDTHFPTDYNLLWDSARKCIDIAQWLTNKACITGWRKSKDWRKSLKGLSRSVGRVTSGGGKNKEERVIQVVTDYLTKARALANKTKDIINTNSASTTIQMAKIVELTYYLEMLEKHIDLVGRRLLQGQLIPHEEKVFSIFQPYAEFIKKGKLHPNVEIGKKLVITTDECHLIVDYQIAENQADSELILPIVERLHQKGYSIQSLSTDKGFSSKQIKEKLESLIPKVIMEKKGKRNQKEKAHESAPGFKRLKNKHSAIESNINELEHRGLNRVPNRTKRTFTSYIALAITAYNLHKIGRKLQHDRLQEEKKVAAKQKLAKAA